MFWLRLAGPGRGWNAYRSCQSVRLADRAAMHAYAILRAVRLRGRPRPRPGVSHAHISTGQDWVCATLLGAGEISRAAVGRAERAMRGCSYVSAGEQQLLGCMGFTCRGQEWRRMPKETRKMPHVTVNITCV